MAKTAPAKKAATSETGNNANHRKENQYPDSSAFNRSKYQPTEASEAAADMLEPEDGLRKLLADSIKDLYWAENHLVTNLPKMEAAASLPALKEAINNHLQQTRGHVERLEQVFDALGIQPQARKCEAMQGLTQEGEAVVETTYPGTPARNLGIIMASQKVEHYEMSAYTGLSKLATRLGETAVAALLEETLAEETESDQLLAGIAAQL